MDEDLTTHFEQQRGRLHAVAYRILGSANEADDAVQEAWMRFDRTDVSDVANLDGWLTTVVARVCLNMLQSRKTRRETPLDEVALDATEHRDTLDPADEAVLAESVGKAMLIVLDTLSPAERLAFVLHDMFAMPFDEIAPIVGREPAATRQLASRARRRVAGADPDCRDRRRPPTRRRRGIPHRLTKRRLRRAGRAARPGRGGPLGRRHGAVRCARGGARR